MSYVQVNLPKRYTVRKVFYSCTLCGSSFVVLQPQGNDLVKYIAPRGEEERWLPTYGKGGYLYLMERLLPDFKPDQEITMSMSRRFEKAFSAVQKPSAKGQPFVLFVKARCPDCGSTHIQVVDESLLDTPPLDWLEYGLEEP